MLRMGYYWTDRDSKFLNNFYSILSFKSGAYNILMLIGEVGI
jgi:hypothetical protein